ncbi:MAG: hypothetical protein M3Q07_01805, partial [Pseudobdellovibrionaceae bacterium]|nr:hypothetical protein [Pseudobdellovibrionaceae bacterium]
MQTKKGVFILSSTLLFAACRNSGDRAENLPTQDPHDGVSIVEDRDEECVDFKYDVRPSDLSKSLSEYIQESPNCTQPSDDPSCQKVEIAAELTKPWCQSKGQRVLLLETGVDQAILRHKRRVLASYKWNLETGKYEPAQVKFKLQKGLYDYYNILNATKGFFPSMYFTRAAQSVDYSDKYFDPDYSANSHGFNIFHFIADYVPYSQFVLADVGRIPKEVLCANNIGEVEQFYKGLSTSVLNIVKKHGISFVNMSNGLTRDILDGSYLNSCARRADRDYTSGILKAYTAYISELSKHTVV